MENTGFSGKNSLFKSTVFSSVCTSMSMGSTKRLFDKLMAPDKPYTETNSKVGLLESGRRPVCPCALMTITREAFPYRFLLRIKNVSGGFY
jgi:hypothetical protein